MRSIVLLLSGILCGISVSAQDHPSKGSDKMKAFAAQQQLMAKSPYKDLTWRNVGPDIVSGRCTQVLGVPGNKNVLFASFATGGFWKSSDAGKTWSSLFDNQGTLSIGAFAVSKSNPDVLFLGTGESNIFRASLSGMGVYKSTDGGKTWAHSGLENTGTISRVIIHPQDPNTIYVATTGNEWSYNKERGLYKSTNGGKSWKRLLNEDPNGVIDLVMHPTDPNTMYASTWNRIRLRWSDPTPADGDHIWKTTDGGKTWSVLSNGLPETKFTGRVGISLSASNPNVLYAYIDNHTPKRDPKPGELDPYGRPISIVPMGVQVWKSTDAGASFSKASTEDDKLERFSGTYGWVFGQIRVDPTNENVVYIMGVPMAKSTDGGKTFNAIRPERTSEWIHSDNHDIWIDPTDPNYILNANDGGAMASYDGGKNWNNFFDVLPTTQFYNITYDMSTPFNIIGSAQDHGSFMASIKSNYGVKDSSIKMWKRAPGGEGTIHAVDPTDPNLIYSSTFYGRLTRARLFKDSTSMVNIYPQKAADEEMHRGEWLAYTFMSPHDNKTIYHGFQYLFKSTDQGNTWKRISGDLSYNNKEKMGKTPYAINHQAIVAIDESPFTKGVLYVGTDDGRVWITKNDGGEWKEISAGLPVNSHVSRLVASKYDAGTIYVTLSDRREDNITPYIFRSTDYGATWTKITTDLPASPVNVVREDPKNANAWMKRAQAAYYLGDIEKAWTYFHTCRELDILQLDINFSEFLLQKMPDPKGFFKLKE